ncbi:DUF6318 family protein [Arthrobacter sp. YD2]|uniref:DUF6318 family protein n=1 Tax=Arthrobacter sp. YD2 TaxID=3058046 RepID=UPI0025B4C76F|nr:DUF6318 family protein [Arthrobacter sp. YD2]MDN3905397.1 DUF6318 family protein [Arthrobacter sp. YD2]
MTRTIARRVASLFGAGVLLCGLVACSQAAGDPGGGSPSPAPPSVSASATPTPTPTPSATYEPASADGPAENVPVPVMPEEAKLESKEGLEAFARYWYEAANYGYETGDVSLVKAISGPECVACLKYYEVVENGFIDDDWMAGAKIDIQDAYSEYVLTPEGRYQALAQLQQDGIEYYGPEGLQEAEEADFQPIVQLFEATWTNGQWLTAAIITIKQ